MAITYPRTLPSFLTAAEMVLRLNKGTTSGLLRGGGVQTVQHSQPYWDMTWTTPPLTRAQKAELTAWWESMRGGLKTFLAYDAASAFPSAYASASAVTSLTRYNGGPFDGTFEITTVSANSLRSYVAPVTGGESLLSSATLGTEAGMGIDFTDNTYAVNDATFINKRPPPQLKLSAGDLISIYQDSRYSLHRIVESTTANSYGNFQAANPILIEPAITTSLFTAGTAVANVIKPLAEFVPDDSRFDATQTLNASPATIAGFSKVIY